MTGFYQKTGLGPAMYNYVTGLDWKDYLGDYFRNELKPLNAAYNRMMGETRQGACSEGSGGAATGERENAYALIAEPCLKPPSDHTRRQHLEAAVGGKRAHAEPHFLGCHLLGCGARERRTHRCTAAQHRERTQHKQPCELMTGGWHRGAVHNSPRAFRLRSRRI